MNLFFIAIFSLFVFISCSNSDSFTPPADDVSEPSLADTTEISPATEDSIPEITIEGMLRLAGGKVTLGTNDKNFKENERPAMEVVLDYDFYMSIHEVTCGEYAEVAKKAKLNTFGKCENDSLPLTDITYYDAVLFANAKSKLEKRDTVYTYRSALFDGESHCTNLEGFAFHADVDGFRLPTEAEWVFAATRAWDLKKSWNNSNSGYKLHPVCSKEADSAGLCDMAGNALEWVNDWMGKFRDTTVINYAGAPNGGNQGERVVKGGYYSFSENQLSPYSRGDVYTVTSSTMAEYVGFRLAIGIIPNALWMGNDGKSQTSSITALASNETVKAITGSYNVKLAFRNDVTGNISYINYQNIPISIQEITDGIDAYHPEISPNGSWVAFCTGMEGVSGKSTIYVQGLDEDSTIQVKLNSNGAVIPRWRVLDNGDTVIVYVSDAGNNKDDATFKSASTWQVKFSNGKFGKPEKIFDGAYHGGISEDGKLAVSGARLLRARVLGKDRVWYNSEQACNASLAQDGTKRTAFLDFGGRTGREFAGSNYATHQRILIADSNGKLLQTIEAPAGYTFDHTEWATNGTKSTIVATLTNVNGAHEKIVLVDPDDNSVTELAEGEELWHPNLWIKKKKTIQPSITSSSEEFSSSSQTESSSPESSESASDPEQPFILDYDSAGVYYNSTGNYIAAQWRYKMEILWQYMDSANIVVLGSSRALHGVDPQIFQVPFFGINLANTQNTHHGSQYIFHNYVLPHLKKLKYVIISVDLDRWYKPISHSFFYKKYLNFPGYKYDANHEFWTKGKPTDLFEYTYESLGNEAYGKVLRQTKGFLTSNAEGWEQNNVPLERDSSLFSEDSLNYYENYNYLLEIIKEAAEHDIVVIGVECPESPAYRETGSYGKYGLKRSQMPVLLQEIEDISKTYPNFVFFDENKMGNHDYTDDMALDADHLATLGAEQLSHRLDSLIRALNIF